ncbi:sensor histidine kinase [Romboutsia sp. 1001713B170207_170306_H8]
MESGFYKLRVENKNIVTLVEDITMSVVNYASNNGLNIVFDTDVEDLVMPVDVNAIERIVLNILSNAIKFTNPGGDIYVNITHEDSIVRIIIEDTGIGIPKDKLSYIFERFNEINKGYIGNVYGSGIGLSMVKSMVNLLGGDIEVESEINIGTKFTITLNINALELDKDYVKGEFNDISNVERLTIGMTDVYK